MNKSDLIAAAIFVLTPPQKKQPEHVLNEGKEIHIFHEPFKLLQPHFASTLLQTLLLYIVLVTVHTN